LSFAFCLLLFAFQKDVLDGKEQKAKGKSLARSSSRVLSKSELAVCFLPFAFRTAKGKSLMRSSSSALSKSELALCLLLFAVCLLLFAVCLLLFAFHLPLPQNSLA